MKHMSDHTGNMCCFIGSNNTWSLFKVTQWTTMVSLQPFIGVRRK